VQAKIPMSGQPAHWNLVLQCCSLAVLRFKEGAEAKVEVKREGWRRDGAAVLRCCSAAVVGEEGWSSFLTFAVQLVRLVGLVGWLRRLNGGQGIFRKTAWIWGKWYAKNLLPLGAHVEPVRMESFTHPDNVSAYEPLLCVL
jgi:hypothetical protein